MRLNLQLATSVRAAPAWTSPSSSLTRSRFLSSTTQRLSNSSSTRKDEKSDEPNKQSSEKPSTSDSTTSPRSQQQQQQQSAKANSVNRTDDELRERLEQMSGEGGASGIEYEDGQPNTMKRSVRNNMFRYI